jgi:hypothetical protein
MVELTIEIPEELASRLQPVQDRLLEIMELGLREISPAQYGLHSEIIDFLASGPSPQRIIDFQPSENVTVRVTELLDKNRTNALTAAESAELDQYEILDYLLTLVKARARLNLSPASTTYPFV